VYNYAIDNQLPCFYKVRNQTIYNKTLPTSLTKKEARKDDEKTEIGINRIRETLAKYDGTYWRAERGDKNSLEYELIVQVKVDEGEERKRILSEIEELIQRNLYFADDMPPLFWNSKEYTTFSEIAKDVPTNVLKEYLQKLKEEASVIEDIAEEF
jgi:hypothetical protein